MSAARAVRFGNEFERLMTGLRATACFAAGSDDSEVIARWPVSYTLALRLTTL
ncbi:MAG: hypothetical protein L0229_10005 [Blastocatellia bacterium]|nr:hypothetical protein [Blastocatellia bacterium]